ncbi:metal ABC transporter solute-binding protein, Zn/Mn family [Wenzhouxiangella sp. EGI_FJ10305]|uniref:metal ABC transporter solute-binding protein, Zn/Mn family n=1 Tax=Wenzhouxiangella sp. EGI_FJ10305 TaxID=3243768 RepID=UPI0035D883E1
MFVSTIPGPSGPSPGSAASTAIRALLLVVLLGAVHPTRAAASLTVAVSIPPQAWIVETIGGEHVEVEVMLPPGATPATYEPRPRQMENLARASLYFSIGAPFEKGWLPRFASTNEAMRIVDTIEHIIRRPMVRHNNDVHSEDEGGNAGVDPHVWLAPPLVRLQAQIVRDALIAADPDHAAAYQAGFEHAAAEINAVDAEILEVLAEVPIERRRFMVFHPAFGYFAESYGLEQMTIEIEGKEPAPRELREVIETARNLDVEVIFVEPQFPQRAARVLAGEIGAGVDTLDPLKRDWPTGMRAIAATLEASLASSSDAYP